MLGHELNDSLATINSLAGSLATTLRRKSPDREDDMARGPEITASRADGLARFMEAYALLAQLPPPKLAVADLCAIARRVGSLEARLRIEVAECPPLRLELDATQIEQLLINVLKNAVEAALETGGGVRLSWRTDRQFADVLVEDEGPGIPNPANLFVPFFTTKPGGSGIGLVLCRSVAENHGGSFTLDNRKDRTGSVATLRLPVRPVEQAPTAELVLLRFAEDSQSSSMRFRHCFALVVLGLARVAFGEPTEAVNRQVPEVYTRRIAPLLTSYDSVAAGRTAFAAKDNEGVVLLSESVYYRDADGTLYRAHHFIYHALAQSAVEGMGSSTQRFDRERETMYLVSAVTILPDGTRVPVEDKGAFVQTPQRQAANSLYTSEAELNLIFSNVAPGTATEVVVVVRENTAVMPGEFCLHYTFASSWPTFQRRLVVDLPSAEWARMQLRAVSPALPAATDEPAGEGRTRRTWAQSLVPRSHWEESAPAAEFSQPTVWLTTLPNWDRVAAWFSGLVAARSDLGPEVAAEVDRLTAGLTTPEQIVDRLQEAVANDVRYTGLEFGLAGYQPAPCRDVWQRRYGDCKDKANLLRAMLAHKGVAAHLVLISTDPLGRVERESPSWRQFNHMILALDDGAGGFRFCDPTVKYLPAGVPALGDLGRDALVLRDGRAVWARTPEWSDAAIRISAELALGTDGELGGWFTFGAAGSDAAYYAEYFNGQERREQLRAMQRTIERFVPGAEVADIDYQAPTGAVRELRLRAYFRRPPRAAAGDSLNFPYPAGWLPELTTVGERRQPYATTPREESIDVTIALPAGWRPTQTPPEFTAPSDAADFSANWEFSDGKLSARLRWRPKKTELSASEYPVLQRSVRALTAWLAQPLTLRHDEPAVPPAAPGESVAAPAVLANFPVLPTGEGQLRLLDEKFPEDENDALRRAALERVLQWFPQDFETVFTAQVSLLRLERKQLAPKAYADRLAALIAKYGAKVSAVARSWAEYLEAQARWRADKSKSALEQMRRLAADETLNSFRRGWAAYEAGCFLGETKPAEAAKYLAPFCRFASDAQEETIAQAASFLAQTGNVKNLEALLAETQTKQVERADEILAKAISWIEDVWPKVPAPARRETLGVLARVTAKGDRYPAAVKRLGTMQAAVVSRDAQKEFARDLATWLKAHPPAWWTKTKDPKLPDAATVIGRIKARNEAKDATGVADGTLQLVLHHEADFGAFAEYVRWTLWWLDRADRDEDLQRELARLSLALPAAASAEVVEIWSTAAEHRAKKGDPVGARELYERIFAHPGAKDYQRVAASGELGHLERKLGRIDEALAAYRRIEPIHTTLRHGIDYLYAALLLEVARGNYDRATEIVAQIGRQDAKYLNEAHNAVAIQALLRAAKDPVALKNYWRLFGKWRKQWNTLLTARGISSATPADLPLAVDWAQLNDVVVRLNAKPDAAKYFALLDSDVWTAAAVPLVAGNFVHHVVSGKLLPTAERTQLYESVLSLLSGLDPVDREFDATGKLWEAALLIDVGRPANAVVKARALYQQPGLNPIIAQAALRVWLLGARTDAERKAPVQAMLGLLESDAPTPERALSVSTLSDVLLAMKDKPRHLALLERETSRAGFDRESPAGRTWLARLEQLRTESAGAESFTKFVREWSEAPSHEWLAKLTPHRLTERRFAEVHEPLKYDAKGFTESERAKFNLLLALDEQAAPRDREWAFTFAALSVAETMTDSDEFAAELLRNLDSPVLRPEFRGYLLFVGTWKLAVARQTAALRKLAAHPLFAQQTEPHRETITAVLEALELLDANGPGARLRAVAILTRRPIDGLRKAIVLELLQDAVLAGEAKEAEDWLATTENLTVSTGLEQSPATIRLEWTRAIKDTRELAPFVRSLAAAVDASEASRAECPDRARRLLDLDQRATLTADEQIALVGHRLRRFERLVIELPALLRMILNAEMGSDRQRAFGCALLEQLVALPLSDSVRGNLLFPTAFLSDTDQPEVRERTLRALERPLTPAAATAQPVSAQAAATIRALIALRGDSTEQPAALFDPTQTKLIPARLLEVAQLRFHASRGQSAHLDTKLESIDPAMIAELGLLGCVRPRLVETGRTAELKLYDEAGRDAVARCVNELWLKPQQAHLWNNLQSLADVGDLGALVPDELFKRTEAGTRHPTALAQLRLLQARLHGDRPKIRASADTLLQLVPSMYDVYYQRALAEHALGDDTTAVADLDVFLKFCLDHPAYSDAVRLRRELRAPAKP